MMAGTAPKTPLIGLVPGVCGGKPIILGTRISVLTIVKYVRMEFTEELRFATADTRPPLTDLLRDPNQRRQIVERVLIDLPHLTVDQVLAAWQYFLDHELEILRFIEEEDALWRAHG